LQEGVPYDKHKELPRGRYCGFISWRLWFKFLIFPNIVPEIEKNGVFSDDSNFKTSLSYNMIEKIPESI
jgi:hypothetical protein